MLKQNPLQQYDEHDINDMIPNENVLFCKN